MRPQWISIRCGISRSWISPHHFGEVLIPKGNVPLHLEGRYLLLVGYASGVHEWWSNTCMLTDQHGPQAGSHNLAYCSWLLMMNLVFVCAVGVQSFDFISQLFDALSGLMELCSVIGLCVGVGNIHNLWWIALLLRSCWLFWLKFFSCFISGDGLVGSH